MAVHSTRRIIWKAAHGALAGFVPAALVNWEGSLDFNQKPPEAPAGTFVDNSKPSAFVLREVRGAPSPDGYLGAEIPATGQGSITYTIHLQVGSGVEFFEEIDEEIRDLLAKVPRDSGVKFVTDIVVDTAAGVTEEGWAAVTYEVPAHVFGDF